jgi:hypothetical protein
MSAHMGGACARRMNRTWVIRENFLTARAMGNQVEKVAHPQASVVRLTENTLSGLISD